MPRGNESVTTLVARSAAHEHALVCAFLLDAVRVVRQRGTERVQVRHGEGACESG